LSAIAGWLVASCAGISARPFTSPSQSGMNPASSVPPAQVTSRYASDIGTIGKIAFTASVPGCSMVRNWLIAQWLTPERPTTPYEKGCEAANWTNASLSCCSSAPNESHMPSLEPVPRTSTTIIAYPFDGKIVLPSDTPAPDFRYGVWTRIVGHG